MTTRDEVELDSASADWKLWSTGGVEEELARSAARRVLFPRQGHPSASLGRYELVRRIGRGGMATVFLATDPALGRDVALKVLENSNVDDPRAQDARRRRVHREATALGRLTHPNVVRVYDVGEDRGHTYIAMEHVAGGTLRDWQRSNRELTEILSLYAEAGRGLAAAHEAGLLHRDFKPDNVLVDTDGRVLVSDFGLVRMIGPDLESQASAECSEHLGEDITKTGTLLGTPAYMAPELFVGQPPSVRTDQFAFCVSLFESLVGHRPFGDRYTSAKRPWAQFASLEGTALAALPRWLRQVLSRGLAASPGQRHASMQDVVYALERGIGSRRRIRNAFIGIGGGLIVAAAAFALPGTGPGPHDLCTTRAPAKELYPKERRERIHTALLAGNVGDSDAAAAKIHAQLQHRSDTWAEEVLEACDPASGRSAAEQVWVFDCLQTERREIAAQLSVLEDLESDTASMSVEFVTSHPPRLRCGDVRALRGRVAPPADPVWAQRVETRREQLALGSMLLSVSEFTRAAELAQEVRASREAQYFPPLALEVDLLEARRLAKSNHRTAAIERLGDLELEAEAQGHDRVALAASVLHLELLVDEARPPTEFRARLGHARARALRLGDDSALVNIEFSHAEHERTLDNPQRAFEVSSTALELARDRLGPEHPEVAYAHDYVSGALANLGDYTAALEHKRAAIELLEQAYGPDSLGVSVLLNTAASIARLAGNHTLARQWHTRAIGNVEARLGRESPRLTSPLASASVSALARGDAQEALDLLERQLALQTRENIVSHTARRARIDALLLANRLDAASLAYEEAMRALEEAWNEAPVWDRADTLRAGAQLALRNGNTAEAEARAQRAIEASRTNPPGRAYPRIVLAQALLERDQLDAAANALKQAQSDGGKALETLPVVVAELRHTEYRLAQRTGDPNVEHRRTLALEGARRAYGPDHPNRRALESHTNRAALSREPRNARDFRGSGGTRPSGEQFRGK